MVEFSSSPYTLQKDENIDGIVIEYCGLVANVRYFSHDITHSIWCVTTREHNNKTPISLRTLVESDI